MTARKGTARARQMALKREMVREIERLQAMAARSLTDDIGDAKDGTVIEGRIVGDEIITEAD
jgi:hypothetical protein